MQGWLAEERQQAKQKLEQDAKEREEQAEARRIANLARHHRAIAQRSRDQAKLREVC